jgi:hypothetical protein
MTEPFRMKTTDTPECGPTTACSAEVLERRINYPLLVICYLLLNRSPCVG